MKSYAARQFLRYGSSGAGGVVNVIDGRIPDEFPDGQTEAHIRLGATSVDQGSEVAASLNQRAGNLVFHIDGTRKEASDYSIPTQGVSRESLEADGEAVDEDFSTNRRLENSFSRSHSLTGGVSYVGDNGFIGVAVHDLNSTYGIPDGFNGFPSRDFELEVEGEEEEEEGPEEGVSIELDQTRVDFNGGWDFNGGFLKRVQAFGGYADYTHTEFEGNGEAGTVFSNEGGEIRVEAIQREKDLSYR